MKHLYLLLFFYAWQFCGAQNLVPNPSFEDTVECPTNLNQTYQMAAWSSVRLSPDYFNECATAGGFLSASVPSNFWGYQLPYSGSAYAGFAAMYGNGDVREYLGVPLTETLQIGTTYYVSFRLSLFHKDNFHVCAVNNIGVLFSTSEYTEVSPAPICNCAQIFSTSVVSDTTNWIVVKGKFEADSNYSFLSVGNFFDDMSTTKVLLQDQVCNAYYYLDDVCVSVDSAYCSDYKFTSSHNEYTNDFINAFPNPVNDILYLTHPSGPLIHLDLFDYTGKHVEFNYETTKAHSTLLLSHIENGIYFLSAKIGNKAFVQKVIKK
ncbi:MAG: T9SS type A sorting domain-containing protein [Bacteroidetes bacterium]|nr:T9SS type A sorting domain-containing protein [Bacteroidota bacterium]MBK8657576.1 T9SS type A sorting domain-containing protein [Bacteroidota bacterium]